MPRCIKSFAVDGYTFTAGEHSISSVDESDPVARSRPRMLRAWSAANPSQVSTDERART